MLQKKVIKTTDNNIMGYMLSIDKSYIIYYHDIIDNSVIIQSLYVDYDKRGKGIGSELMKNCFEETKCKIYYLDDMSDRFLKKDNIYIKHGFKYVNDGEPEMIKIL